jgi:hypothetical protein
MMGDYNFQVDMGGPYRDAFNADLNVRAAASDRRWTDKAAEVAALAAAQATRDRYGSVCGGAAAWMQWTPAETRWSLVTNVKESAWGG